MKLLALRISLLLSLNPSLARATQVPATNFERAAVRTMLTQLSPLTDRPTIERLVEAQVSRPVTLSESRRREWLKRSAQRVGSRVREIRLHARQGDVEKTRESLILLGRHLSRAAQLWASPTDERLGRYGGRLLGGLAVGHYATGACALYGINAYGEAIAAALVTGAIGTFWGLCAMYVKSNPGSARGSAPRWWAARAAPPADWVRYWSIVNEQAGLKEGEVQSLEDLRNVIARALDVPVDEACASAVLSLPTSTSARAS